MSGTTAARREALRAALISAAERAVAAGGLEALKARDLALEAGCSLGAIYNVFPNLDALALAVNQRTLAAFGEALRDAGGPDFSDPAAELKRRARIYADFATANPHRWRAVFDHAVNAASEPLTHPDRASQVSHLFEAPLREILSSGDEAILFAHALLAGIQGIVHLGLENEASVESLREEVEILVEIAALGLTARGSGKPLPQPYERRG